MKETQYIAVKVKEELGKLIGTTNVKSSTGGVTDYLRNQWGLTDVFKELLLPRHTNLLENENFLDKEYNEYQKAYKEKKKKYEDQNTEFNDVELSKDNYVEFFKQNFIQTKNNKTIIKDWSKRIDHRHHAIDALVVACTSQAHIQRLNNLNKELQTWLDSNRKEFLPDFEGSPSELLDEILNLDKEKRDKKFSQIESFRKIDMPWKGFPSEAKHKIEEIIVSHKPKDKLLIQKNSKDGTMQMKIRGQLHDGTLYGKTNNVECYKIPLTKFANNKFATEKSIVKIVNPVLKKYISEHLDAYNGKKEEAFSAEGILTLNTKLAEKKDAKGVLKPHTPIKTVKIYYKNQDEDFDLLKLQAKKAPQDLMDDVLNRMVDKNLKELFVSHIDKHGGFRTAFSAKGLGDLNKELELLFTEKFPTKKFKPLKKIKLIADSNNDEDNSEINTLMTNVDQSKDDTVNEDISSLTPLQREKAFNDKLYVKTNDNYLFAVLEKEGERFFDIISFFEATSELKKALRECLDKKQLKKSEVFKDYFEKNNKNNAIFCFALKQNDMVYMPNEGEIPVFDPLHENYHQYWSAKERVNNIYVVQKFSKKQIYFLKHSIAIPIENKVELGSQNCYEKVGDRSIKEFCFPISVDRLGRIVQVGG